MRSPEEIALDTIADLLDGREWSVEDLDTVAEIVRDTGREIRDPNYEEPDDHGSQKEDARK
jgi:hypothetical protein